LLFSSDLPCYLLVISSTTVTWSSNFASFWRPRWLPSVQTWRMANYRQYLNWIRVLVPADISSKRLIVHSFVWLVQWSHVDCSDLHTALAKVFTLLK
jgi:hypothetical protein